MIGSKWNVRVGDTVRVTLQGKVQVRSHGKGFLVGDDEWAVAVEDDDPAVTSVQIVKPVAKKFNPGDIIRRKNTDEDFFFVILDDNLYSPLFSHRNPEGRWVGPGAVYNQDRPRNETTTLDTEYFEKVGP